ncbi:hypothetical protein BKK44_10420 [Bacillus cereus]|nr:hypothetical protein BKK44_10420 [Bacillus cereus]
MFWRVFPFIVFLGAFLIISPMLVPSFKSEMPLIYNFIKFFVFPSYICILIGSFFIAFKSRC